MRKTVKKTSRRTVKFANAQTDKHSLTEEKILNNLREILAYIGDDPSREGLLETPHRILRSWKKLYGGYQMKPQDVLKTFVFERHKATGTHGVGFVKGFNIKCGAMASTVAHDAHNLLVIGTNDEDMALAANTLIACGGGMCAVQNGKVLGCVELPLAGLMNVKTAEEMSDAVAKLDSAWKQIGCDIVSPFMTMALIPLACLPELRLTNRGLVDCTTFSFSELEVE
jgi:adenine deaminase